MAAKTTSADARRILIVEDDFLIARDEAETLRSAGYRVVGIAECCRTAVELAEAERPDLVVMDIRLAGRRDGVEAAILIRQRCGIPCLFVTAQTEPHVIARAAPAHPAGWLTKPVTMQRLAAAVAQALDSAPPSGDIGA